MATATINQPPVAPDFAQSLMGDAEKALEVLQQKHPDYAARWMQWRILLDAFEASGGFLNGAYLWPYPREIAQDFADRQMRARYHNYLESLVDLYVRFIFTQGVKRSSDSQDYNDWLENTDGSNTSIDDLLKRWMAVTLVHGHAGLLIDKSTEQPDGPTMADERGRIIASVFPALSIPDWRFDRQRLTGVKLLECEEEPSIAEPLPQAQVTAVTRIGSPLNANAIEAPIASSTDYVQYLLWDEQGWARFDKDGELIDAGTPNLGLVPLIILRAKPSYSSPMLGRPLVSNANVIRAQYNRASEEDQVLRDQAFSQLTVEVPTDGNVENAKQDLGGDLGTQRAIVVRGKVDFKTPDQNVPKTIRDNIAYLVQEIYRSAHVRFKRDSLDAESADAIRLQQSELNEMLQGFAKALAQGEQQIARAWFAWNYATPEFAQAAYEAANIEAEYPTEFFLDDPKDDIQTAEEAIRLNLGETMTRRIKKAAVRRIDPNIPPDELEIIDAEIDKAPADEDLSAMQNVPGDRGGDAEGVLLAQATAQAQDVLQPARPSQGGVNG